MSQRISYPIFSQPNPDSTTLFQATGTALTGAYALAGAEIRVDGATTVFFHLYWTKGDETSIQIKCEWSLRAGGTTSQETVETVGADATGLSVIEPAEYSFNTATDNLVIPFRVAGRFANISVKTTGGTPTGTYGAGIHCMRE